MGDFWDVMGQGVFGVVRASSSWLDRKLAAAVRGPRLTLPYNGLRYALIRKALLVSCLAASCLLLGCNGHGGVYVVRHADRDGSLDKLKIPEGTDRAQALADLLDGVNITAIFSTNTVRTTGTAQPLATRLGLDIIPYATVAELVNKVKVEHAGEVVLVVGHSNTVPDIVTALGADLPAALPLNGAADIHHDDFDNFVLVLFHDDGGAGAAHGTYGAATPPP